MTSAQPVDSALTGADEFVATSTLNKSTVPNAFQASPRKESFIFGRFQQQVLGLGPIRTASNENEDPSEEAISPLGLPDTYDSYLNLPSQAPITSKNETPVVTPNSKTTHQVMQAAITTLNAGLFLQNLATVVRSGFLAQLPQSFNLIGSSVNLVSLFVPKSMQLALFVMGLSMNMGGLALSLSQVRGINADRLDNTMEAYGEALDPHWRGSFKEFPHPNYIVNKGAKQYSSFHLMHPGALAELARKQYRTAHAKVSGVMFDKLKLPKAVSFIPDVAAGTYQLLWMNGKMATDWGFAIDALRPMQRSEFTRGSKFPLPNAPEYVLALASIAPLVLMGGALVLEGFQKAKNGIEKKFDPTKPVSAENNQQPATSTAIENTPEAKKGVFQHAKPLQLAANISAVLPAFANLMFVPIIEVAGAGNPVNIAVKGSNFFYRISPKLDATLVKYGSIGAITAAAVSTASGLGWTPKVFSDTADLAFLGFTALSNVGMSRNTFSNESRTTTLERTYATPDQHQNMTDATKHRLFWESQPNWIRSLAETAGALPHPSQIPSAGNGGSGGA